MESGGATCARCEQPIRPGEAWDLDHADGDSPTDYIGVSHARCNRRTNVPREPEPAVAFRARPDGYFEADGLFYRRGPGSDSFVRVSRAW